MMLDKGTRLGVYEIQSAIGAGGMGEVYRAKDTKLGRDVALKILPASFTNDPERVARFRREAQVLASLNHPHIGQIYGLDEANGTQFLVLELVDGESLDKRIARGRLPVDEALEIARQIAEALEAAHERGIIHRDLKPANIAVTKDGNVKVLDFGLAKAVEMTSGPSDLSMSPTITSPAMVTGIGTILGTAAYMSPEQAKGRPADKRSDIWAFGCLFCEMLTGTRAFEGDDVSDTLAAVLRGEADLSALPSGIPTSIRALLEGCLKKDRKQRIGDISTALFLLNRPYDLSAMPATAAVSRPLWRRAIPVVLAATLASALTGAVVWRVKPSPPLPVIRFPFTLAAGQRFTTLGVQSIAMSPDGSHMVYVANERLYVRSMSELEAKSIPGTEITRAVIPVFSPDGQSIAYWSPVDRTLKRIGVSGGTAVTICPVDAAPFGVSWGPDGVIFGVGSRGILFGGSQGSRGIMRVSANGGTPERLVGINDGEVASSPQVLPGGQSVLFTLATGALEAQSEWDNALIVVQSLKSSERKTLIQGGSDAHYLPTGHIVYAVGGTLFAVPYDLERLRVTDGRTPIVEGVRRGLLSGSAHFSVSNTGSLIYIPGPASIAPGDLDLALFDRKGGIEPLKLPPGSYEHPRVSPDGKQIAFGTENGKEAIVWIYDLSGTSSMRRLTFGGRNRFPIWSADGQRVAFQSDREGDLGIFWQRADGTGPAERVTKPDPGRSHTPESWSPRGDRFSFSVTKGSSTSLWTWSRQDKKAEPFGAVQSSSPIDSVFSPDGRWLAYTTGGAEHPIVFVQPFPSTGATYQISNDGAHPLWSPDGKELFFYQRPRDFCSVSITTQPTFTFKTPKPVGSAVPLPGLPVPRDYDISSRNAMNIGPVRAGFEELKARVPTNWNAHSVPP